MNTPAITETNLSVSSVEGLASSSGFIGPADIGDVLDVFTNTWSYSTIGLVYDQNRDIVRYAHESQSSTHNPTIYDVGDDVKPPNYTVVLSIALSSQNSGWPWQLDNLTGAGYDPVNQTYFLPDYNGDLSYADDNIVEVDPAGNILNAWEMDDEVGSNDSSDHSEIDSVIDIAVVPGTPPRYFVTAAYDDNVVYEINLTKTGNFWTPNTWSTVATYTVPTWDDTNDNLGIDYDAQNGRLFHSSWDTTTVVITDLELNELSQFDCPGAGGYNTGVTFIEGSNPPEVWVTDFNSDKTTRCQTDEPFFSTAGWGKQVNGTPWTPAIAVTTETSATIQAVDVITAGRPFTLSVNWDPARLEMLAMAVTPPLPDIITATGALTVTDGADAPDVITLTKIFLTQPSTWTQTIVSETLTIQDSAFDQTQRPFTVTKTAPQLNLTNSYNTQVLPANVTTMTLDYSNTGGFENDVVVTSTFPVSAPFFFADPSPDRRATDGSWAEWEVGNLANTDQGEIEIYVYISPTLTTDDTFDITSGIYNHADQLADAVTATLEVSGDAATGWTKTVNGVNWSPSLSVTEEVSGTFQVVDVISGGSAYLLADFWDPTKLTLESWSSDPEITLPDLVTETVGSLSVWSLPGTSITLTKTFALKPCTWTQTLLWEQFVAGGNLQYRPVPVNKEASSLALDNINDTTGVYGGEQVTFQLAYSNTGGFENEAAIQADFPTKIWFVSADPSPTSGNPGEPTIEWNFSAGLTAGQTGTITITANITDDIPAETILQISGTILDHVADVQDTTVVTYQILAPDWQKLINGVSWHPGLETHIGAGRALTVTDIITTGSDFSLVDYWNGDQLKLVSVENSHGTVATDTLTNQSIGDEEAIRPLFGEPDNSETTRLTWDVSLAVGETVTITRLFRSLPFTETYTVLWENLRVGDEEWARRPVWLENTTPHIYYFPIIFRDGVP